MRLWDAATGEPCATLPHPGIVPSLAYSLDGTWLVSGNYGDDRLRIWDSTTARVRKEIHGPEGIFRFVTVSPDGMRVAATAIDAQNKIHHLRVCDVGSGERLFSAEGGALAYSPDGRWLAVRDADEKTVLLLDAGRMRRPPDSVATRSSSTGPLSVPTTAASPRAVRTAPFACGRSTAARAGFCAGTPTRSSRRPSTPTARAWPRPAATERSGCGTCAGRGGSAAAGSHELRLVAGLQPRRRHAGVRLGRLHGSAVGHGAAEDALPGAPRGRGLRPEAERLVARLFAQPREPAEVVARLRADQSMSDPLRHAALRAVMRRGQTDIP